MWDVEASSKFEQVRGGDMSVFRRSECIYNQRLSTIVCRPLKQAKRDCKNCSAYTLYINYTTASAGECKCEYEFKSTYILKMFQYQMYCARCEVTKHTHMMQHNICAVT